MPCYDHRTSPDYVAGEIRRELEPLLCSACRVLARLGYDFDENPALSRWWADHQAADAQKAR